MNKVSRRSLAGWAADELAAGRPARGVARHLAAVLSQSNMAGQLDFLLSDIAWELERSNKLAIGNITSARPLSGQLESALKAHIKKATKAGEVTLQKNIDKSIIGGVRIETASHVWDQTISRKLSELKEVF